MLRWGVSAAAGVTSPLMNAFATAPADWLPNDQSTGSPTSRPTRTREPPSIRDTGKDLRLCLALKDPTRGNHLE
jgi:hypothetical protein